MKKIKLDSVQGDIIISQLKANPPVVLCGSAVSGWEPTSLPTGSHFTEGMFSLLFPHSCFVGNNELSVFVKKFFEKIPFEHLLERCPNQDKLRQILNRAFSIDRYNIIHKTLAERLVDGRISALITTNYDLCFDKVLDFADGSQISKLNREVIRVITENDFKQVSNAKAKIYFKIHGSADNINGETLVFALTHESYLPDWKRQILSDIIKSRPLLIIGYSGKDFEICPELVRMEIKQLIWNEKSDKLTYNAQRLLEMKNGIFLEGNMIDLFEIHSSINYANRDSVLLDSIQSQFSQNEIMEWRASLSNSMGFPSLAFKTADNLLSILSINGVDLDFIKAERQKAQALFHLGKYKQSAILFRQASKHAKQLKDDNLRAELLLDICSAYMSHGSFFRAIRCKNIAYAIAMTLNNENRQSRILGDFFLKDACIYGYLYPLIKGIRLPVLTKWFTRKGIQSLRKSSLYSLKTGNWFGFYHIRLLGEKMDIDPISLTNGIHYGPPPVKEGYEHLGYYIPQASYTRDQLSRRKGTLSPNEENELCKQLEICRITDNFPEIWKILWLGIKHDPQWRKNYDKLREFYHSFQACEYSIGMRILKLILGK